MKKKVFETKKGHIEQEQGPQKAPKIRKNQSVLIKFRLPHPIYTAYEKEREKAQIASVPLFCKAICADWWPSVREYRIKEAMEHLRHSEHMKFTANEMMEAKQRLLGELRA